MKEIELFLNMYLKKNCYWIHFKEFFLEKTLNLKNAVIMWFISNELHKWTIIQKNHWNIPAIKGIGSF